MQPFHITLALCLSLSLATPEFSYAQLFPKGAVKVTKLNTARFRAAGRGLVCYTKAQGRVPGKLFQKKIGKKKIRYFLALKSILTSKLSANRGLNTKARAKLKRKYSAQLRRARRACDGLLYSLIVSAENGTVVKNPDRTGYAAGTEVLLTALPNTGYQFGAWSGDGISEENKTNASISIIIDSDMTARAVFAPLSASECADGLDNDADGKVDFEDFGCLGPNVQETDTDNGWMLFHPSADTVIVYVSSAQGDDNNDGLSPERPVKTVAKGKELAYGGTYYGNPKRNGSPDWLLLKRGDTWTNEAFGGWAKSGRSPSERMLIGTYGDSLERPLLKTGSSGVLSANGISNFAMVGLDFYAHTRDPNSPDFASGSGSAGMSFLYANKDILIEGNRFRYYTSGINVQEVENGKEFDNVRLRRNVIAHSYSTMSHSQGLYTSGDGHLLIEENIFDHNGWSEDYPRHNRHLVLGNREPSGWRAVTDGRFRVKVDGAYYNLDGLNFSAAASMHDVAQLIEEAINLKTGRPGGVDVTYWKTLFLLTSNGAASPDVSNVSQYTGTLPGTDIQIPKWLNGRDLCEPAGEPELPSHHKHMTPATDPAVWRAVTNGSFNITLNGTTHSVTGMNFSSVAGMNDVASVIDNAIDAKAGSDAVDVWWVSPILYFRSTAAANASIGEIEGIGSGTNITVGDFLNCHKRFDLWYPAATVFNRNMYLSGGYGNTITRGNIDANGASGGMQQRMGGVSEHNLVLWSPLGITFGHPQNPANTLASGVIRYNVLLGAHDIDRSHEKEKP